MLIVLVCSIRPWHGQMEIDIRELSRVTMKLMQGYEKERHVVGLDRLETWSIQAVTFLSDTTSAASVRELMRVS